MLSAMPLGRNYSTKFNFCLATRFLLLLFLSIWRLYPMKSLDLEPLLTTIDEVLEASTNAKIVINGNFMFITIVAIFRIRKHFAITCRNVCDCEFLRHQHRQSFGAIAKMAWRWDGVVAILPLCRHTGPIVIRGIFFLRNYPIYTYTGRQDALTNHHA